MGQYSFFIAVGAICVIGVIALLVLALIYNRYKLFVLKYSNAIKSLILLNGKYFFITIPSHDMKGCFDNEKMFASLSPKDYLTYQLVYKRKIVKAAIDDVRTNVINYSAYSDEIKRIRQYGHFNTEKLLKNTKILLKVEERCFNKLLLKPTLNYSITVVLVLTNIKGEQRSKKREKFDALQIEKILKASSLKNGDFYLDESVWEAICRVERAKVTNKIRFSIYKRDGYRCKKCGIKTNDLEIDHIFPISKGGKTTYDNLQTLCKSCNMKKSNIVEAGTDIYVNKVHSPGMLCDKCGAPMVRRSGKYGVFYGCINYPKCKSIKKI